MDHNYLDCTIQVLVNVSSERLTRVVLHGNSGSRWESAADELLPSLLLRRRRRQKKGGGGVSKMGGTAKRGAARATARYLWRK